MKYSIDGVVKGKTIKSVDVIKQTKGGAPIQSDRMGEVKTSEKTINVIVVNYLDGTQDVFEFNAQMLANIEQTMIKQAESYAEKRSTKNIGYIISQIGCLLVAGGGIAMTIMSNGLLQLIISLAVVAASGAVAVNLQAKKNDLKKYELFIQKAMGKVDDYKKIIAEEAKLSKTKAKKDPKFTGIRDLDRTSMQSLNQVINKVERYQGYEETESKGQKVKSI